MTPSAGPPPSPRTARDGGPLGVGPGEAAVAAQALARVLPPALGPLFDASFIRSSALYDEFVHRLVLRVFREAGLEAAVRDAGTVEEIATRAGFEIGRARIPLRWILRHLTARGVLADGAGDAGGRFGLRAAAPDLDPAVVRDEQAGQDVEAGLEAVIERRSVRGGKAVGADVAARRGRGDGADRSDSERPADLPARVHQA